MAHLEAVGRTPATIHGYRSIIAAHLLPAVGRYRANDPALAAAAQRLVDDLSPTRSPRTVRNVVRVLHAALEFARRRRLTGENAAGFLDLPALRRAEIHPLSEEEALRFVQSVRFHRLGPLLVTTLALGLRQSEAVALQWDDVDLDAGTLTIRRRAYRRDGVVHVGLPKSEASRRTVAVPETIVELLRDHRSHLIADGLASLLVFPAVNGDYLHGPYVTRTMQALLERAGIPRRRFHDLRHTAATLLRILGADIKEVQAVLGHSDYRLTADVYTHILDGARRAPAARIDSFLAGPGRAEGGKAGGNQERISQ